MPIFLGMPYYLLNFSKPSNRLSKLFFRFFSLPTDVLPRRNPQVYLGAAHHLSLPPERCAMVATHLWDLRAAAGVGMRTIYVPRPGEDKDVADKVKSKDQGGEVDMVVSSFVELASVLAT